MRHTSEKWNFMELAVLNRINPPKTANKLLPMPQP